MTIGRGGTPHQLSAVETVRATRALERTCVDVVGAALERIEAAAGLRAWAVVDREGALAAAARLDREGPDGRPLFGLPLGVKDIFDTADLATSYGSPIYADHRPAADAACVATLRRAGAIVVGKTACTEFASTGPTETANPRFPGRTPGGSSSGSAAAVAAALVPVSLASQTAGSIIRPASYCAVIGYKPTFASINRAGVLPVAASLDTVGLLAGSVADAALVGAALTRPGAHGPPAPLTLDRPPHLGFARTPDWERIEAPARAAIEAAVAGLAGTGAVVDELTLPAGFAALIDAQRTLMAVETAHSLAREYADARDLLSDELAAYIAHGLAIAPADFDAARRCADAIGLQLRAAIAPFDAVLTPSTTGVPPLAPATGDPHFCRAWTLFGGPAVAIPIAVTGDGLPAGLQLVGVPGSDDLLLRCAAWAVSSDCHTRGPIPDG